MDYAKLKAEIIARKLDTLALQPCADALNAVTVTITDATWATERTLYASLGPTIGEEILQRFEAAAAGNPVIARVRNWLKPAEGGIDLGHPSTQAQLDALQAGGVLTAAHVAALKGLATQTVPLYQTYDGRPFTADDVHNSRAV